MSTPDDLSSPLRRDDINVILRGASPEIRKLLRLAHEQQFRVSATKSHHFKIMTPRHWQEKETVFAPGTPSDIRGLHRVVQKLRRIGVRVPHK